MSTINYTTTKIKQTLMCADGNSRYRSPASAASARVADVKFTLDAAPPVTILAASTVLAFPSPYTNADKRNYRVITSAGFPIQ